MATPTPQPQPQQPNQPPQQPQPVPAGVHPGAAADGHAYAAAPNAGPGANGQPGGAPQWQPNGQAAQGAGVPAQGLYQQAPTGSLHFTRMLQSEWTKIRTVRSTMWSLIVMVVLIVGMAALLGATVSSSDGSGNPDPSVSLALIGVMIAQIAAATLGVLTISAEYTTGMIRSTLTAYPRRITVLAAKSVVFGALMFVVGLVACYLGYLVCDALVDPEVAGASSGKEVVKGVVGSATYLALIGLFALGVGTMLRHSAGAITAVLGIMLVPSIFGGFIPGKFGDWVVDYSPMMLLIKMVAPADDADLGGGLGPWPGMVLMACYAAAALAGAAALIKSRDV
jgi:ABC-2 type transport system permease protein